MHPTVGSRVDRKDSLDRAERRLLLRSDLLMEPPPPPLTRPLLDAVSLFEELGIAYALIGGLASIVHGRARPTDDVDFVADGDHEAVLAAHPQAMKRWRFDPTCTWKLYHDSGAEVDLWKDEHTTGILRRAVTVTLADRAVRVVEPHDLIAMKLRADRAQDLYDVSEVLKRLPVDDATIRERVTPEQFEHYLFIKRRYGR